LQCPCFKAALHANGKSCCGKSPSREYSRQLSALFIDGYAVIQGLLFSDDGELWAFGYLTIDLVHLLSSNAAFIVRHGW
jgi:hypothetical protein